MRRRGDQNLLDLEIGVDAVRREIAGDAVLPVDQRRVVGRGGLGQIEVTERAAERSCHPGL